MSTGPAPADRSHTKRIYASIDELSKRVSRLERNIYIGTGAVGAVALFNLISNLSRLGGG